MMRESVLARSAARQARREKQRDAGRIASRRRSVGSAAAGCVGSQPRAAKGYRWPERWRGNRKVMASTVLPWPLRPMLSPTLLLPTLLSPPSGSRPVLPMRSVKARHSAGRVLDVRHAASPRHARHRWHGIDSWPLHSTRRPVQRASGRRPCRLASKGSLQRHRGLGDARLRAWHTSALLLLTGPGASEDMPGCSRHLPAALEHRQPRPPQLMSTALKPRSHSRCPPAAPARTAFHDHSSRLPLLAASCRSARALTSHKRCTRQSRRCPVPQLQVRSSQPTRHVA
jgi:hypothetical protein